MRFILYICIIVSCSFKSSICWETEDFEIFDVVEEVNKNFYELMAISPDAGLSEIKKAYRTLSLQLHPDKNKAEDAEIQFRQMVSVYEVLKDEKKRKVYDKVLVEGIPDWRSPIYYYRRARKMSLLEIAIILTVVISITQYLMAWGTYWDQKHTLEDYLLRKFKIKDGKKKRPEDIENLEYIEEQLCKVPRPTWWKILPIQLVQLVIFLAMNGPSLVKGAINARKDEQRRHEEEIRRIQEEEKRVAEEEEKRKERKAEHKIRKKVNKKKMPDYTGRNVDYNKSDDNPLRDETVEEIPVITGGPWCEDDYNELTRLMNKYPGGTQERWDKIAAAMCRTTYEVIKMSSKVKATLVRPPQEEVIIPKMKVKTKATLTPEEEEADSHAGKDELWTVEQQKALEKAIKKHVKGTEQRWEKIANSVPEKTKEDCMMRFKFLAEKIRKKKEEEERIANGEVEDEEKCEQIDIPQSSS